MRVSLIENRYGRMAQQACHGITGGTASNSKQGMESEANEQLRRARSLRRRQTDAEAALWVRLRDRQLCGVKFRRQQPLGPYIVDFVTLERQLVIEIDGSQHADGTAATSDEERTVWLGSEGYRVLRFWNNDVLLNMEGVLERILQVIT